MDWSNVGLRTKIFSSLFPVFAALLSGVLLVLTFPDYNISWLAWVGLVPLLLGLYGRNPLYGYFLCFVFSTVYFSGICIWVFDAQKYTLIHHALVMLFLGAPLALFGLAFCFISRRRGGVIAFAAAPSIWVVLEYVRSNLSFLALPWGFLAHSQSQNIPFYSDLSNNRRIRCQLFSCHGQCRPFSGNSGVYQPNGNAETKSCCPSLSKIGNLHAADIVGAVMSGIALWGIHDFKTHYHRKN